jgi:hypothetical protein
MAIAQVINGVATELDASKDVVFPDGSYTSQASVAVWTEAQRNAAGLYTIAQAAAPPDGQVYTLLTLTFANNTVTQSGTLGQAPALSKNDLLAVAADAHQALTLSGITVNVGVAPTVVNALVDTTLQGRIDLMGLFLLAQVNPAINTTWVQSTGNITINATQIQRLALVSGQFIDGTYGTLSTLQAGIAAGSITAEAQITTAFAAVPVVY